MNPAEVAGFPGKVRGDFLGLQSQLSKYVVKNELSIVYAKAFAAKALQLANKMNPADRASVSELIEATVQNSQLLTFYGEQMVTQCTTTNYANRSRGGGVDVKAIFFSFNFSGEETQMAHSKSECSSYSRSTSVGEASALSSRIGSIDYLVAQQWKQWGLLQLETPAPFYPTWGLPYN
ncbi:MAG: hypothetical protein EOP04_25795 [Proteobacteria bacterium]|nr:MAG: hypothetical protein EOP04_25795 [Pseudomonadota bacterium]